MEKEVAKKDGHYQLPLPFRKRDKHCVINEVKNTGIKDMLNKIYHTDFSESVQPREFIRS